jgi:lysylphosphatidylglycerol synthase-like protein
MTPGLQTGGHQRWTTRLSQLVKGLILMSGLALLGGMVWQVGLAGLQSSLHAIGPWILPFLLLDSVSLWLHTVAWAACFQPGDPPVSLWHLSLVRLAGSAVNWITPTASIGGEVAKVWLLEGKLPRMQATAAVVIDKASVTLAQMVYLVVGMFCVARYLPLPAAVRWSVSGSMGVIAVGLVGFLLCQRYGVLSRCLYGLSAWPRGQATFQRWSQCLAPLEVHLGTFYTAYPGRFMRSVLGHGLAFLFDAVQTYILLGLLLGAQAPGLAHAMMVAVVVAALEQMVFFVSGSLGTLEAIRVTALSALGVEQTYGVAFALVARLHNLFWNGLGLVAYALCTSHTPAVRQGGV